MRRAAAALTLLLALAPGVAGSQQLPPMPKTTAAPKTAQHAEYVVEVNRKGQVVKIRSAKHASDKSFDERVDGNALQVFIRKPDGSAVAGVFRLTYDYDPKTKLVTRRVELLQEGGVDPDALGAFARMSQQNSKALRPPPAGSPSPLPDFSAPVKNQ